jgi:hypothetical protein
MGRLEEFGYSFKKGSSELPHVLQVNKGDDPIAHMQWDPEKGKISDIHVEEPYRRQGVATSMWNKSQQWSKDNGVTPPAHSPKRTEAGDAWAKSVGGSVPEKEHYERNE